MAGAITSIGLSFKVRARVRVRSLFVVGEAEYIGHSLEENLGEGHGVGRRKVIVAIGD